jgi:hypothetical protein
MSAFAQNQAPAEDVVQDDIDASLAEEFKNQFGNGRLVIDTTAFKLKFKSLQVGDNHVDMARTLLLPDVLNALANASARGAARDLASLHNALFGRTAMAEGTCGSVDDSFEDDYTLKPEFCGDNTVGWIAQREKEYASLRAYLDMIDSLIHSWGEIFANAPNRRDSGPQFAVVRNADPRTATRQQWIPILDPMKAIDNFYKSSATYLAAKRLHEEAVQRDKAVVGTATRGRSALAF